MSPTEPRVDVIVENHCPYGCDRADLDEHGYCRHLVGFTNDGKVIETVQTRPNGIKFVSGKPEHLEEVEKGDRLVNPQMVQIDNGVKRIAQKWVSSRVYRKQPRGE